MLLSVLVASLLHIGECTGYIGASIATIGPDTFGCLGQYQKALADASLDYGMAVKVADYINSRGDVQKLEIDMLSKYNEVNAILVSTSRYYYNYRHAANLLALSSKLYELGLVSRNNMLSLATETCLCHPTNSFPGRMYVGKSVNIAAYKGNIADDKDNIFLENMYIPYRSSGTRLHHLRYIMTQRFPKKFPRSSRITTKYRVELGSVDPQFDLPTQLVFLTGHGGDRYFQFQAKDVIAANDIELYMSEFFIKHPNVRTFMITDTCQASTMFEGLDKSASLAWVASSPRGVNSYSYNANSQLTVSTVGKFTFYLSGFVESVVKGIKERGDRVAVSRFSLGQLKRHMERHCPEESAVFHANHRILHNNSGVTMNKMKEGENSQTFGVNANSAGFIGLSDMKKVYLGQFVFNYRTAYFNGYRWPLGLHTRSNDLTTLKMQHHECCDLDNDLFLRLESGRLHGKIRECGLLTSVVQEPSKLQIALAILFLWVLYL
ncbi:hypothetical protein X943_000799 [Babesia divergens]|uniref:GPI-anchor transamidase n=1 Tax=Babesia divergens TaxID=32595 RepID=A0AAD9GE78_BABDI|nr:hypothetical protein X943_000799 [Babesia divergens]